MAKKKEEEEEEEKKEEEKPKSNKKLIIILAVVGILVLGGVIGGVMMLGKSKKAEDAEATEEATAEGEAPAEGEAAQGELPGAVLPLETFIVNLSVKGSFLKANVQLQLSSPEEPKTMEHDIPKIRNAIIRILSNKEAKDVLNNEGKDKLRDEIKAAVNQVLGTEEVSDVYFTEFIVQ